MRSKLSSDSIACPALSARGPRALHLEKGSAFLRGCNQILAGAIGRECGKPRGHLKGKPQGMVQRVIPSFPAEHQQGFEAVIFEGTKVGGGFQMETKRTETVLGVPTDFKTRVATGFGLPTLGMVATTCCLQPPTKHEQNQTT